MHFLQQVDTEKNNKNPRLSYLNFMVTQTALCPIYYNLGTSYVNCIYVKKLYHEQKIFYEPFLFKFEIETCI